MTFQIQNLVLYSHDGQRRELRLNSGVNIITGKSKTGKSAIIEIIEFCLARKDCPVSDGVVLESVSWYLAHLKFPNLEVIVARPGPTPETAVPSEMYFAQGTNLSAPEFDDLKANSNREAVQRELSQLMGIAPNRNLPDAGSSGMLLKQISATRCYWCLNSKAKLRTRRRCFIAKTSHSCPRPSRTRCRISWGQWAKNSWRSNKSCSGNAAN